MSAAAIRYANSRAVPRARQAQAAAWPLPRWPLNLDERGSLGARGWEASFPEGWKMSSLPLPSEPTVKVLTFKLFLSHYKIMYVEDRVKTNEWRWKEIQ